MHVNLFCDTTQYGRQAAILFQFLHVPSQYLNMTGPIFLRLGKRRRHYVIHMPVNLFCDMTQYGCRAAILFQFLHVQSHYLNMTVPIFLKLGTRTRHCVIHTCMHLNFFCDRIQYGRQMAILFQFLHVQSHYLNMPGPIFLKLGTKTTHLCHTYLRQFVFWYNRIWLPNSHFVPIFTCSEPILEHDWTDFSQTWYKDKTIESTCACEFVLWYTSIWPPGSHFVSILNQYLNMTVPIFLKLCMRTRHYAVHMHVHFLCDMIQYGCQAAFCFTFSMSRANTWRWLDWFFSNLVQGQDTMVYIHTTCVLQFLHVLNHHWLMHKQTLLKLCTEERFISQCPNVN